MPISNDDRWNLVTNYELPLWLQNKYLTSRSHRPVLPSYSACYRSIFSIHTETGNIWTHLVGCLFFIILAALFFSKSLGEMPWQENALFAAFFTSIILCLAMSFNFHTLLCHSLKVKKFMAKMDYCGIALLIMGCMVPWPYYAFNCRPHLKVVYLSCIFVVGSITIVISLFDCFGNNRLRFVRSFVFTAFGLCGVVPNMHYLKIYGWEMGVSKALILCLMIMGIIFISGALIYTLQFPEKGLPGRYDLWPQSHQIFHLMVVLGATIHLHCLTRMKTRIHSESTCSE